jgi:Uma2 family endonuclease
MIEPLIEIEKPMPSKNHSFIQSRLTVALFEAAKNQFDILPELSLELITGKATPDICIYPKLKYNWLFDEVRLTEPPLTVIEILSPKQGVDDLTDKIKLYFGAGVKSYWVVIIPFKSVNLIDENHQTTTFLSGKIKDPATGIEIDMDEIFR